MAKVSGNDLVVRALQDEGVDTAFYVTGGPMVDVAVRCLEVFRTIDVRHEQAASMAAHAYSRVSGKPGVCFGASGPGRGMQRGGATRDRHGEPPRGGAWAPGTAGNPLLILNGCVGSRNACRVADGTRDRRRRSDQNRV